MIPTDEALHRFFVAELRYMSYVSPGRFSKLSKLYPVGGSEDLGFVALLTWTTNFRGRGL